MAKRSSSIPLSSMVAGLNRFEQEAGPLQTVDAENVFSKDGDLRRRPSFRTIATSPPYVMPAGICWAAIWNGTTFTRVFGGDTVSAEAFGDYVGSDAGLLVGCPEKFDGIDLTNIRTTGSPTPGQFFLRPRRVDSLVDSGPIVPILPDLPWFLDETVHRDHSDPDNTIRFPIHRPGRISWHKGDWYDEWAPLTISGLGLTGYWILLDLSNTPPDFDNQTARESVTGPDDSIVFEAPGVRVFQLCPVDSIFPVRNQLGAANIVMSGRRGRRGQELGAQAGIMEKQGLPNKVLQLLGEGGPSLAEGSGVVGEVEGNDWAGSPVALLGNAGQLTKAYQDIPWTPSAADYAGQWGGQTLLSGVTPLASPAPSTTAFSFTSTTGYDTEFENLIVVCTTSGGGPALSEARRCIRSTFSAGVTQLEFSADSDWSAAPTTSSRFKILSVPFSFRVLERNYAGTMPWIQDFEIYSNSEHRLIPAQENNPLVADKDWNDSWVHYEIGKELRYLVPSRPWDGTFDPITRQCLFCNGGDIYTLDGRRLRELTANSDEESASVQEWLGLVNDLFSKNNLPRVDANAFLLSKPPQSRFIRDFMGRLVTAYGKTVRWSAPGGFNNLWPRTYESLIRDQLQHDISGLDVIGQTIVAYTPNSIHASAPADEFGMFYFQPVSQGIGFINHKVVCRIPVGNGNSLIGANADGVYLFDGVRVITLLDDWKRLLPFGVNKRAMKEAVAGVSLYQNLYFLAVPSQGSTRPDKLLVYDFAEKKWYVWTAPFLGITSIAAEYDSRGKERMLFGTYDGHICTLAEGLRDDGDQVEGYARTPPVQVGRGTMAIQGLLVTMGDLGDQTVEIGTYINEQGDGSRSASVLTFKGSDDAFSDGSEFDDGTSFWTDSRNMKTRKVPVPSGTRAEIVQVQIKGTGRWRLRRIELLAKQLSQRSR